MKKKDLTYQIDWINDCLECLQSNARVLPAWSNWEKYSRTLKCVDQFTNLWVTDVETYTGCQTCLKARLDFIDSWK